MVAPAPTSQEAPTRLSIAAAWAAVSGVADPEIPVISVVDLGIVRGIAWSDGQLVVTVTPTYSGCPATEVIAGDIERALIAAGAPRVRVDTQLSPAWTTGWMTAAARQRLRDYGISPPGAVMSSSVAIIDISGLSKAANEIPCPRCASLRTTQVSRYGSTPCKAQYRCGDCLEPFDYFKPH